MHNENYRAFIFLGVGMVWLGTASCDERIYSRFSSGLPDGSGGEMSVLGVGGSVSVSGSGGRKAGAAGQVGTTPASSGGATLDPGPKDMGGAATGGAAGVGAGRGGAATGGQGGLPGSAGASMGEGGGGGVDAPGPSGGAAGQGAAGAGGGAPLAKPRIISVDFVGMATRTMSATEVAGFKPAAQWNAAVGAAGSLSSLVDQNGVVVPGLSISWSADRTYHLWSADSDGNSRMLNGYLDPSVSATITVTGVPAAAVTGTFDVFLYCLGNVAVAAEERIYNYTLAGTQLSAVQRGISPAGVPVFMKATMNGLGNYVEFPNVAQGAFVVQATPGGGALLRAPVNGIQLVLPPGS